MSVDLSILVCSTDTRYSTFAVSMMDQLVAQRNRVQRSRVEVIMVTDAKGMSIGRKRNMLVRAATGRYVQFVDDDDRVAPDMISTVLDATEYDCDVIVFPAMVSLAGGPARICHYSKDFGCDRNTATGYQRIPNHICAVKRDIARHVPFADICMGEDADYARRLLPHLKTEHRIDIPLYYYDYDPRTSECRR